MIYILFQNSSCKEQDKPNVEIVIQDHSVETRNKLKRNPDEIYDSPKKIKYEPEESAKINHSPMRTKGTLYSKPLEKSLDNFDDRSDELFHITSKYEQKDDCSLFGKLLTIKLRTYSVYERNLLMYKIDGLLIENPPGFDTTPVSNLTNNSNKTTSKVIQSSKKKATSTSSAIELHSYSMNSEGAPCSSKKTRVKKESASDAVQISSSMEEFYTIATPVTPTSVSSLSPVKTTNDILNQPAKTMSSNANQPANVTSSKLNQPVKVTNIISKHPVLVKSSIQYQPIKVSSSVPNQTVGTKVIFSSLPTHLPLQITIPQTKFQPQSKFVASSLHPKAKIVIIKSKSKYFPSSQPPILIKVPSLPTVSHNHNPISTECDMNSLEQLSSIAATHASKIQQYEDLANDINVASHEMTKSESVYIPAHNNVETALKNIVDNK